MICKACKEAAESFENFYYRRILDKIDINSLFFDPQFVLQIGCHKNFIMLRNIIA